MILLVVMANLMQIFITIKCEVYSNDSFKNILEKILRIYDSLNMF